MIWISALIDAVVVTGAMFIAHAAPLNSKVIEPGMAARKRFYYAYGFAYYAAAVFWPLLIVRFFSARMSTIIPQWKPV